MLWLLAGTGAVAAEGEGVVDKAAQGASEVWQTTKEGAGRAAEWTGEKAEQGWDATKSGAAAVGEVTVDTANDGWDATRQAAGEAWGMTRQGADKVWNAVNDPPAKPVGNRHTPQTPN